MEEREPDWSRLVLWDKLCGRMNRVDRIQSVKSVRSAAHRILERGHQMVWFFGSVTRQPWFLPVVLVTISAVSSWEFACITPFVAFAVAAGYTLSGRAALLTVAAIWLVNQATGFAVLGYPWTVDTILWGFTIGAAALLAAALAGTVLRLGIRNDVAAIGAAFVLAFGSYEGALFLVTFGLGGAGAFTRGSVGHVALLSLGWTVALVGTHEILQYSGAIPAQRSHASFVRFPVLARRRKVSSGSA